MNLVGLPPALLAAAAVIAMMVSAVLGASSKLVARVPGLGPNDETRDVLMRALVGALNLAGMLAYAWSQRIVLSQEMIPALVLTAAGYTVGVHYVYTGIKAGVSSAAPPAPAATPATVPQVPADALPA